MFCADPVPFDGVKEFEPIKLSHILFGYFKSEG